MFIKSLHRFLPAHITLLFVFLLASCDQAEVVEDVEEPASKEYVVNYYNCGNADCATTSANVADKIKDNFHQYLFDTQIDAPSNPASSIPTWFNIAADDIAIAPSSLDDTSNLLNTLNADVQLQDTHRQELFHYVYPKYLLLEIQNGIVQITDNAEKRGDKTKKVALKQANFTSEPPFIYNNNSDHLATVYIDDYISLADNTRYLECINSIGFYHKAYVSDATALDATVTEENCKDSTATLIADLSSTDNQKSYFSIINLAYTTDLKISFLSSVDITNEPDTLDVYYGHTKLSLSCSSDIANVYYTCNSTYAPDTKPQSPVVNLRFIASGSQYKIKNITLNNNKEDFFKDDESTSEDNTQ